MKDQKRKRGRPRKVDSIPPSTMTVRADSDENAAIIAAMKIYNEERYYDKIKSKAAFLIKLAKDYPETQETIKKQSEKIEQLQEAQNHLLAGIRSFVNFQSFVENLVKRSDSNE